MGDNACFAHPIGIIVDMIRSVQKIIDTIGLWIGANQFVFLAFFVVGIMAEVFVFQVSSDMRLFLGVTIYWYLARLGKLPGVRIFQLALVLLVILSLSYLAGGASTQTERLAVWFVLFFAFGIVRKWRDTTP